MANTGERGTPATSSDVRIIDVDPERFTCRVQTVRGEYPADQVVLYAPYVANRGGGWMGALPEVGDFAVAEKATGSQSWAIKSFRPLPRTEQRETADEQTTTHEFDQPRNNYAAGRAPARPGDMGMWGSAGNRVVVRRAGVTEVLADEITWTRYFADEHSIRTSAATIETQGVFGINAWYTLRDEEREAAGATPTGYSSWVKTHAEASPNVNVEFGAVLDDEELRLPGRRQRHDRRKGNVCARLLVFDQDFADRYAALGRPPDSAGARLAVRADEEGNVLWSQAGTLTQTSSGHTEFVAGRKVTQVQGSDTKEVLGDHVVTAEESVRMQAGRSMFIGSGGDLTLQCARFVVEADNDVIRARRQYVIESGGDFAAKASNRVDISGANGVSLVSGAGMGTSVGGRWITDVLGASDLENLGRDVRSWGVKVHRGKATLQASTGSFEISIGPELAPLAQIKLHQDARVPSQIGRIEIGFPLTGTGLTLSPDGSWDLSGPVAGVKCDAAGRIQLGGKVPTVGHIVSTLTHPVDFVTGLPILGHSTLLASASPPLPLYGTPSAGVVHPTVNLPDEIAS